ncbi:acyl-homoserine lactone acylase QuiP [Cupriavidus necator N-1]|jgi:penicillin amidase|uniref:Acyl-homoserine lactone acylase QuiP n=1 Tax=Cupriavidus necator (strain ATCC 43291 / DSM 13513 / CCUG 52238 / LMG 8453 / N-1) TaxID=1042878 RepID=G0EX63_CUPNN|nr:penicillin acylase family protein [Cupriavidus necator]AEI77236.1 acyl-homoserine lactone acylase QuiP [Cupriavidus necator N-1]KAI3607276.1 N-acyl-homoserine lactone acylase [Cupriavidus necator H850]MDX6014213.1 penicillin acylase family protein [Cupriavidus necator]
MRWFGRLARFVVGLLVLAVAGAVGALVWYRHAAQPPASGQEALAGLRGQVAVVRDGHGVPHIRAASKADAWFALGYVHAQDRLWQMQMNKRVVAGRLAEILGPSALDTDKFLRTLGVRRNAEAILAQASPETRAALQAYADGVNAWIDHRKGPLPPEFLLLRAQPERWEPADTLGWQTMMAWDLGGNWTQETLRMRLAQVLPVARISELLAPYPGEQPVRTMDYGHLYKQLAPLANAMASVGDKAPPGYVEGMGSNNWVVSGAHTQSGKPMLANDPHLGLQAPALWYFARMTAPGLDVTGATLPGMPLVVLGHNDRIAWGLTNTAPDVQDLYIERLRPGNDTQYQTPDGWAAFETRTETIRVKGAPDVVLKVRATRHGPVISDVAEPLSAAAGPLGAQYVVAFQWTALRPDDRTFQAGLRMNEARDWAGFTAALRDFHSPQQNIVYADVDGNIGFYAPGRVPLRRADNDLKGLAPAPGWDARYDWTGFIPFEALPHRYNPADGVIVTANQRIVAPDYPYFITSEWTVPYRFDRIQSLLAATPRHSFDSFAAIQKDVVSLAVRDALPLLLAAPVGRDAARPERERALLEALRKWDGTMDPARAEPLVVTAWLRELSRRLFEEKAGEAIFVRLWEQRNVQQPMLNILRDPRTLGAFWCDRQHTRPAETCDDAIADAWTQAMADLSRRYGDDAARWRWGEAHTARSEHKPFGKIAHLSPLFNLRVPTGGDTYTVNVGRHNLRDDKAPFENTHAASVRALYDLANLEASRFMDSTGQSGNALLPRYRDWTGKWAAVEYVTIPPVPSLPQQAAPDTLILVPAAKK